MFLWSCGSGNAPWSCLFTRLLFILFSIRYLVEFLGIGNDKACDIYFRYLLQDRKLRKY